MYTGLMYEFLLYNDPVNKITQLSYIIDAKFQHINFDDSRKIGSTNLHVPIDDEQVFKIQLLRIGASQN